MSCGPKGMGSRPAPTTCPSPQCLRVLLQLQEALLQVALQKAQLLSLHFAVLLLMALLRQHDNDLQVRAGGRALGPLWALSQPRSPSSRLGQGSGQQLGRAPSAPGVGSASTSYGGFKPNKEKLGPAPQSHYTEGPRPLTAASLVTWLQLGSCVCPEGRAPRVPSCFMCQTPCDEGLAGTPSGGLCCAWP